MANMILTISKQQNVQEDLEKYTDIDMSSVYKEFAHKAPARMFSFAKEQANEDAGQFGVESEDRNLMRISKKADSTVDVDYSGYKIAKNINVKSVQQAIHNIFTWMLGERVINPEFGTNLRKYLYEGITQQTEELINAEIRQCIARWEPRAQIVNIYNVGDVNDTENNTMHLQIVYTIPSLSDKQYSYSYYYNKTI